MRSRPVFSETADRKCKSVTDSNILGQSLMPMGSLHHCYPYGNPIVQVDSYKVKQLLTLEHYCKTELLRVDNIYDLECSRIFATVKFCDLTSTFVSSKKCLILLMS